MENLMLDKSNFYQENIPKINEQQIQILEQLCQACSVSGDEGEVRKIVLEQISSYVDELKVDALGNILAIRNGKSPNRLRIMLAAHMDEVGFMITDEGDNGFFRFDIVGGIDERQLVGKPIIIGEMHKPGVIGAKPIHLTTNSERNQTIALDSLRIDVGTENDNHIKIGDRATFASPFLQLGPSILAKALDDRLGVLNLIELIKHAPENIDLLAAFTVQEEVGLRGARVAAHTLDPQLAIALDCTPASDLPIWDKDNYQAAEEQLENVHYNVRLGDGPAIYVADRATIADPRWVRHLENIANKYQIPYQIRQPGSGGTDAGAIHLQRDGIPSISVSVPARYIHSSAGITRLDDWQNSLDLVYFALADITQEFFSTDR
jgi:tetrahedral aminopeptidase